MSNITKKIVTAGMGSALLVAGGASAIAAPAPAPAPMQASQAVQVAEGSAMVQLDQVVGTFSFTQTQVTDNAETARVFAAANMVLCGSTAMAEYDAEEAANWVISIDGAVSSPIEATVEELASTSEVQSVLMGCTCAANPADGLATVNAMVEGIPMTVLLQMAGVEADANTIVFVSDDGYEVALPLSYVINRYCPLVFKVNGSPLVDSVGGVNQLWLGSTSANYFARNIVEIRLEVRDVVPAASDTEEACAELENLPNIGIKFGGEIA